MPYLMASYIPKGSRSPGVAPEGQIATGVMVASASPNFVPAPTSNPNYGASTQTALVGSKKNAALQAMPLVNGPAPVFEQFAILPEIGPILAERPEGNFMRGKLPPAAIICACRHHLPNLPRPIPKNLLRFPAPRAPLTACSSIVARSMSNRYSPM